MNLEQLRKQAKDLVRAARDGDSSALVRLGDLPVQLASAQLVLAREHGFPSWPALVHDQEATVEGFVVAATECRRERAERLLAARPEIERDRWAQLVLGRGWDGDANEVGGPRGWAPLHYACHSVFANLDLVGELLGRGADPNAYFANEYGPMSALYGAAGVLYDPELTRVLLEGGADPNGEPHFGDALYHSVESERTDCLRILLEGGAQPNGTNALAHALDYEHALEHVRLLLDAGADPSEGALVAHAVRRGRGPEFVRLLAEYRADLGRPGGETWRGNVPLRTPYAQAVLRSRNDVAAVLEELGASTEIDPGDRAVAAVARGERAGAPAELDPDAQEVLILGALRGALEAVVDAVGVGFAGVVGGSPRGTLLHHASWVGDADIVRTLLERGADPVASSDAEFDTPLAWAALASQYWRIEGRDYVRVVELLLEAGAQLELRFLDVAEGPLAEMLESRI
jgi:ankyrin repeat protein